MVSIIEAVILGIIQGITEWLPISSSGHLVLFQHLFNITQPIIFDIILHLGSLLVILIVFRKEILRLIKGIVRLEKSSLKFLLYLVLASIPIALVGLLLNDFIKSIFDNIKTVGFSLLFTSFLLFMSKYPKIKNKNLNLKNTLIIGLAQSLAILPGVSRSGTTISTGMIQGIRTKKVAVFSFLLFIPAILGATILELKNISQITDIPSLIISLLITIITGFITLKLLLKIIRKNKFRLFGWYCLALGLIILFIAYF